jgi:pyruvate/2-oxoglutarate dehydrogenase complex dihydrolipoamide acyltransferase (E2) component
MTTETQRTADRAALKAADASGAAPDSPAGAGPSARAVSVSPVAPERRPTLRFLEEIRPIAPVFLDTEVDMTRVQAHRAAARERGMRYSTISYVLHAAARVLAEHPEANAAIRGRIRPTVARYPSVNGKITLDKTVGGRRVVRSAVLPDLQQAELDAVQAEVDRFRTGDVETMPEFAPARLLQRLPWPLGQLAFRLGVRPLARRHVAVGTFAVTSLGHRPVDGFHSVGGTTITLGLGRTADRPVVRDGALAVAPVMRLSLTFDHRVVDGAEAADVLAEIKDAVEGFPTGDAA